jgi:hypothetical protein
VNIDGLFKRGEMVGIAKATLASGPQNTRQLSAAVLKAKGLDPADKVLAKAIPHRLIHACGFRRATARLRAWGRQKAAKIWRLGGNAGVRQAWLAVCPVDASPVRAPRSAFCAEAGRMAHIRMIAGQDRKPRRISAVGTERCNDGGD